MTKARIIAVLAVLAALALPSVASAATSQLEAHQWDVGGKSVSPAYAFTMRNEINHSLLGYGHRRLGVDLTWGDNVNWRILRYNANPNVRDHRGPAVTSSDKVAIYNTKFGKYLVHAGQTWGIDLGWSRYPSYEWKLDVNSAGDMSLYNTDEGDYVVYGKRPFGINLMWLKDLRKQLNQSNPAVGSIHDATVWLTAQQVIEGYVPFVGRYGGGGWQAVLTKVTVPNGYPALRFVKPNHSTTECGNDSAVVPLGPGQTLTTAQMTAIWGTSSPSLAQPVYFVACAAAQGSTAAVNIQYRTTG
jgi:hypothetical protein